MNYFEEMENELSNNYNGMEDEEYSGFDELEYEDFDDEYEYFEGEELEEWIGNGPAVAVSNAIDQFKLSITNTTGIPAIVALFPGYIPTERPVIAEGEAGSKTIKTANGASVTVDDNYRARTMYDEIYNVQRKNSAIVAVLDDGVTSDGKIYIDPANANKYIKVTPQRGNIREFISFLKKNPTFVKNIVMETNDVSYFSNSSINVMRLDPYNEKGSFNISPSDFLDTRQNQDKKVVIDTLRVYKRPFQIDRETLVTMQLAPDVNGTALTVASLQFNFHQPYSVDRIAFQAAAKSASKAVKAGKKVVAKKR